jgi:hypothetical protein
MLEIKFDPSTLTKAQREDLASFILGFESTEKLPLHKPAEMCHASDSFAYQTPTIQDPNEIFGAPSSAGADPSLIVQEVTTATTSTPTLTAPPPPVPNNVTPGTIAAPQSQNLAEVDKKGMRWDARIHSSSKAKIADGTWKYRRGVTDEEIKRVEGELTGNPTIAQLVSPTLPQQGAKGSLNLGDMPQPHAGGTFDPVTLRQQFAQLMLKVAKAKGEGKLTAEEVTATLQPYGVASLPLLANKLEAVPQVAAAIDAILGGKS